MSSAWFRTGVVGVVVVALLLALDPSIPFASAAAIAVLVPAAAVDLRTQRLPDVWVGSAAGVFLVAIAVGWATGTSSSIASGVVAGSMVMATPLLALHLISPSSMGFGDVKAAIVLGAALGAVDWQLALAALALGSGATATVGLVRRARQVPFGPGLVGGSMVALAAHELFVRA